MTDMMKAISEEILGMPFGQVVGLANSQMEQASNMAAAQRSLINRHQAMQWVPIGAQRDPWGAQNAYLMPKRMTPISTAELAERRKRFNIELDARLARLPSAKT